MFSKLAVVATVAFAIFAAAAPAPGAAGTCDSGNQQCCNSVQNANSPGVSQVLAGLLGVDVGSITGLVGLGCANIIGGGCTKQTVCCDGNNFNGLAVIGCTPINVN